jgi:hypothetical protein
MECQSVGVEWPTVTRPVGSTSDQILPAASRSCVCGHPVYDEQEPRCPLCACQEHKPRLLTAGDHSAPATVSPVTGDAWRGPQPELPGPSRRCLLRQHAAARNPRPRTLLAWVAPAARGQRCPAMGRPGRTQPPCGRDRSRCRQSPSSPGVRPGYGRPRPSLPARRFPAHAAVPAEPSNSHPGTLSLPCISGREPVCLERQCQRRIRDTSA